MDNFRQILRFLFPYTLALVAFSIPISYRFTLYALGLAYLVTILLIISTRFSFNYRNRLMLLLPLLWLFYLISIFYSKNLSYGLADVFQKISLLLIPLIFIPTKLDKKDQRLIKNAFITGLLVSSVFFIFRAFYRSLIFTPVGVFFRPVPVGVPWDNFFFYDLLVQPHHPTYYSMYLSLGIAVLAQRIKQASVFRDRAYNFVILTFFTVVIFFTSSKAGIIASFLVLVIAMFWILKRKGKLIASVVLSVFFFIGLIFMLQNERIRFVISSILVENNKTASDHDTKLMSEGLVRFEIWKSVPDVLYGIEWLTGVGVGDVKDEMLETYKRNGIQYAFNEQLNAHNQYLQTLIGTGVLGLSVLLGLLGYSFWLAYKNKDMLLSLFLIIISVNFMFESVLERVFGVIFFTFFLLLLTQFFGEKD